MNAAEQLNQVRKTIPDHCTLIAVSKTHPVEKITEVYAAGQRVFGENKVQELVQKAAVLPPDIEWHLIGHLQTNKVKQIVGVASLIHSIDSLRLLEEVEKQAAKKSITVRCLLQVHIAKEETKFGFSIEEIQNLLIAEVLDRLPHIEIAGLMGMATLTENQDQIRAEFRSLRQLFTLLGQTVRHPRVKMKELSMGMSSDYPLAIEEGSTMVRIGSAIFGSRNYSASNTES